MSYVSVDPAVFIEGARQRQWDHIRDYLRAYARRPDVAKVVVVGNAPLAADTRRAGEIDEGDLVIRLNSVMLDAPGSPPAVGTSCHAVLLSRSTSVTPWVFHRYRERAYLVPQAGFVQHHSDDPFGLLLEKRFWPADLGSLPLPNAVVKARLNRMLDPDGGPGTLIPTTGTMALYLAHEMFPEAELVATGFSFLDDPHQTSWAHHSGGKTTVNPLHRLDLEARLLQTWLADGSLRRIS